MPLGLDEPKARRTIFASFRRAAIDLWGEAGLRRIGEMMSDEARRRCIDAIVIEEEMLPERYVLEWYEHAWSGPANRDREAYNRFLDRMMDHGFGRVRKLLLAVATPHIMAKKASELWRHDHTHGDLIVRDIEERSLRFVLENHPYLSTPLARSSIAEIYRYAVSLTRVSQVGARHVLEDANTMVILLDWR